MIDIRFVQLMARYNRWQNENLYGVADTLPEEERRRDRGAFFGSIHATLNHLLWADRVWMGRFRGVLGPEGGIAQSVSLCPDWQELGHARAACDAAILAWADGLDPAWLEGDLLWRARTVDRDIARPRKVVLAHFFNHQTHHRGQVHSLLTQAGGRPHETDLIVMP